MVNKIAFISDIHSNLTALKAVLEDIENNNVDYIVCLGDIVGKGPRPNECINLIREKCKYVIRGNLEVSILKLETKAHGIWNKANIDSDNKIYLDNLPLEICLEIDNIKIKCIHAFSNSGYMRDVIRLTELDKIPYFDENILIYGDIHHQYVKKLEKKYIFNTGSIGVPLLFEYNQIKNINLDAEYLILYINNGHIDYEFKFVSYDKNKEIEYALKSSMPHKEKYIMEITKGKSN